jgi:hypothetical protein
MQSEAAAAHSLEPGHAMKRVLLCTIPLCACVTVPLSPKDKGTP